MLTIVRFTFWCIIVYTETAANKNKPRAVNLALETVIEFDNKDRLSDLKFIDQVQGFLNKVKYVLKKDQNYRRVGQPELKFSDFIKSTLAILNTYEDEDLEKFIITFTQEARKFNYRGCKFYELTQNSAVRQYIGKKLDELNEMTVDDVRSSIDNVLKMWNEGKLGETNEEMIDYIDSLYKDDAAEKIAIVLNDMDLYRRDEKQRATIDLTEIVKKGLRSLIFDHYSNLKARQRNDVKLILENSWFGKSPEEKSHDLFNSYLATDMNRFIEREFETTSKRHKYKTLKEVDTVESGHSHEFVTKRSHKSDHDNDHETKENKATSSAAESEETKSITKVKKIKTTISDDETSEETAHAITKVGKEKKVRPLSSSIESAETTTTTLTTAKRKKPRKHSFHFAKEATKQLIPPSQKEETTKHMATTAIESSVERSTKIPKHVKITTNPERITTLDDAKEISSTSTTTKKKRKHKNQKTEKSGATEKNHTNNKEKHSKHKKQSKKHSNKKDADSEPHSGTKPKNFVKNKTDITTATTKQKGHRKHKTKQLHDSHHSVAFRNFELSDDDSSVNITEKSSTDPSHDDIQDSSDYENPQKSRKYLTSPGSVEGMSIESFEDYKSNIRKHNDEDAFPQKKEIVREVVPDIVLTRLSELEKELQAMKSHITIATKPQTSAKVGETVIPTLETTNFPKSTTIFIEPTSEKTRQTTITASTTKTKVSTTGTIKTSTGAKSTTPSVPELVITIENAADIEVKTLEHSADFKVITRNRSATTKSISKDKTPIKKSTTGRGTKTIEIDSPSTRMTKTIKYDSPNLKARSAETTDLKNPKAIKPNTTKSSTSENRIGMYRKSYNKDIFISVENESNVTGAPYNETTEKAYFKSKEIKAENNFVVGTKVKLVLNDNVFQSAINATGLNDNRDDSKPLKSQDFRRDIQNDNVLKDDNKDGYDDFDPDDLLDIGNPLGKIQS